MSSVECSPCADCEIIISDDDVALQCDLCDNWYFASCMKIEKRVYEILNKCNESHGIMWFCSHCRISLPGTKKLVKRIDLESQQSNFERQVKELKELVSKKLEENGSNHEINIADIVSEALSKQNERDNRKLNAVCFRMKESDRKESR